MTAMKLVRSQKTRRSRTRGSSCRRFFSRAATWAVVLLQVHLFFVLQLHQHQAAVNQVAKSHASSSIVSSHQEIDATKPLCPACRVMRQGFVHADTEVPDKLPLPLVEQTRQPSTISVPSSPFLKLSGRDPPHC